ncbi:MAG: GNAT family N-acetyltransferase, partial [Bacteroidota bacterium]
MSQSRFSSVDLIQATPADAEWLLPFAKRLFLQAYGDSYTNEQLWGYLDKAYQLSTWQAELASPLNAYFIAKKEEKALGYLRLAWGEPMKPIQDQHLLEINRLYVAQEYQGRGVAQRLMDFAIRYGKERGFQGLWLSTWKRRSRSLTFYNKYDFEPVGT